MPCALNDEQFTKKYGIAMKTTIVSNKQFHMETKQNIHMNTDRPLLKSVDPDQRPQKMVSDQGLHCSPYTQQDFRHIKR